MSWLSLPGGKTPSAQVLWNHRFAIVKNRFATPISTISTTACGNSSESHTSSTMLLLLLHSERITTVTQPTQNNTQQAQNSAAGAQPRDAKLYWLGDLLTPLIADNDAAIAAVQTGQPRGPQTGITALDKGLGGSLAPGLHILQASPGAGKTAMALQVASDCLHPALYVSAEMPTLELFKRLIARQSKTFLGKLNGQIASPNLENLAQQTIQKLPHLAIMDAMAGLASVDLIRQTAEAMRAAAKAKTVLIVLDSLHVWARGLLRGSGSDYEIISEGTRCATELAALLNAPILAICHRNREGNKSGGGLHSAKGTGDLEYEAWTVLDLHRNMNDREDSNGEVDVNAHFCKNRSKGLTGAVGLKFSGRLQSFRDV